MKSLYDAVGSSIKLPQNGTKTLKLRLTVSPDATKVMQQQQQQEENLKQNITDQTTTTTTTTTTTHERTATKQDHSPVNINVKDSPAKEINSHKQNNVNKTHHSPVSCPVSPCKPEDGKVNISPHAPLPGKPRLSSIEQKQLAELVQKNMERHHRQQLQLRCAILAHVNDEVLYCSVLEMWWNVFVFFSKSVSKVLVKCVKNIFKKQLNPFWEATLRRGYTLWKGHLTMLVLS